METVEIFDTTLRDGLQVEGVSATVEDKLRIAEQLDHLGVTYIEGGWPGANPKDIEFFAAARTMTWQHARLAAFGSTRHKANRPESDPNLRELIAANRDPALISARLGDRHRLAGDTALSHARRPVPDDARTIEVTASSFDWRSVLEPPATKCSPAP